MIVKALLDETESRHEYISKIAPRDKLFRNVYKQGKGPDKHEGSNGDRCSSFK